LTRNAVLLAGSLGLGHEMMASSCTDLLDQHGWHTRTLDSMSLLGPRSSGLGEKVFNRLVSVPGLYDGLHFAHLRTGSRLAGLMGEAAIAKLVPALRAELERRPADLVLSVFATGASAAARLRSRPGAPHPATVVLCTDVTVHRLWVSEGTDLFLVTSRAAEASVRRYLPRARVAVVPPPVRSAFYTAPTQQQARAALCVPADGFCVLVMDSGWGFGPLAASVQALADAGVHVLAVAGRQQAVERRFRDIARRTPTVTPFGFTDRIPELMAAADVVVALPGATTCSEARVVGRQLLLLDVMPGHGRDNLLHELELGDAHVCVPTPEGVTASALALREVTGRPAPEPDAVVSARWEPAFTEALQQIGLDLPLPGNATADGRASAGGPAIPGRAAAARPARSPGAVPAPDSAAAAVPARGAQPR
jgi:processive 1,2-diacylglycerol beta-glucosyltransferase